MAIQMTRAQYEAKYGMKPNVSSATPPIESTPIQPMTPKPPSKGLLEQDGAVQQFGTGIAKGALQTVQGLGQLGLKGVKALTGKDYGTKETFFKDPKALEAQGGAEKVGKFAEQVAEFAVPGTKVAKLTQGAKFIPKIAARMATSAAVTSAQQGEIGKDVGTAALTEAVIPIAGKIIKPATKFLGNLLKGTSSALSGAPSEAIEKIYQNPQIALQTAKEIKQGGSAGILRKNAENIIQGVSKIKQEARGAYGKGLDQLSEVDINPTTFRTQSQQVLDSVGSVMDRGVRKLGDVEFDDPKNLKKANELINKLSNAELNGKSLRKLVDDIENSAYKTATSDERLAFNAFVRQLSGGVKETINASTGKLDEINKAFTTDMQLAEAAEDIFGNVKYKNLGEILKASQKLEGMFSQKGLAPEVVDDFLERAGMSSDAFKAAEAMRQVSNKTFSPNSVGTSPLEIIRAFTSAIVSPKMVGKIAAYTGLADNVVKEMSQKLSPTTRAILIKSLTGNPQE